MLAHTHGQPATPTTLGKELAVLAHRLRPPAAPDRAAPSTSASSTAPPAPTARTSPPCPTPTGRASAASFVEGLGLTWNPLTTQIESHDWQAELYADLARFNRVLHNLCTDVWTYISLGYFAQVRGQGTVGSSTMPHKVNPIRFENAEANLEVSQRAARRARVDAGNSPAAARPHRLLDAAQHRRRRSGTRCSRIDNVARGLAGLDAVPAAMAADLDANWEVLGEAVQSAMRAARRAGRRRHGEPYERLKELTRGRRIDGDDMREFVAGLGLPDDVAAAAVGDDAADLHRASRPSWSTTWTERRTDAYAAW